MTKQPAGIRSARSRLHRARADHAYIDVTVRTFKRFSENDGGFSAAALTYYFFFSIFPLLLFAAALLGYLTFLNEDLKAKLFDAGLQAAPLLGEVLSRQGLEAIEARRGSLAVLSIVLALYSGSGAVVAMEHSLNKIHGVTSEPNFVQKRLRSLKWLAAAGVAVIASVALSSVATFTADSTALGPTGRLLGAILGYLGGMGVGLVIFMSAFKLLPAVPRSWRDVFPGALAAAVAFEVLKVLGTWYLARGAAGRAATFGDAFATAAALLVASYLLAQITLLAAELNAVLAEQRAMRTVGLVDSSKQGGRMDNPDTKVDPALSGNGASADKSAGQLMREVTEDISTLFRKEIELAKQELSASATEKAKGAAILAIVGVFAFFALIFFLLAIRDGLDNVLWTWVADIVTAVILLAIGGIGALVARKKLSTPISADLTKKSIREDVEFAKTLGRR